MLTKEEFKKEYIRMMDGLRTNCKGEFSCEGVSCDVCPLKGVCQNTPVINDPFELIEFIEKWSKEHPKVTYKDKFKEVFGVEPCDNYNLFVCPLALGLKTSEQCDNTHGCGNCKKDFWDSEYKPPVKENEHE